MTPFDLSSLARFQTRVARGDPLTPDQSSEFERLKRQLPAEIADDPATFTDESRRPQLDGTDYLREQQQRSCDQTAEDLRRIAVRVGREVLEMAMALVLAELKRR